MIGRILSGSATREPLTCMEQKYSLGSPRRSCAYFDAGQVPLHLMASAEVAVSLDHSTTTAVFLCLPPLAIRHCDELPYSADLLEHQVDSAAHRPAGPESPSWANRDHQGGQLPLALWGDGSPKLHQPGLSISVDLSNMI
jgi:hypothetical protein